MRKKVRGKLYFLARDAKSRMRNYYKERSIFEQVPYAKICFNSKEQELYERVCRMLDSDEIIINPIKELMDHKYYNSLSIEGRQRYISDLSEKYKEFKLRYEREHELKKVSNI